MTGGFRAQWSFTNCRSWHIKAFCSVCTIQMEVVFFSSAVYCHFTPDLQISLFLWNVPRWVRTLGPLSCARTFCPQFKISAASVASFESKESMLFCLILREIQLIFCVCVSHNSYVTKQAGDGGFATLSCLQYIHNLCRASWNCR